MREVLKGVQDRRDPAAARWSISGGGGGGAGHRFLAGLAACRGTAPAAGIDYRRIFYGQIEKEVKADTALSIERLCELGK
jgi:hypothetical protein